MGLNSSNFKKVIDVFLITSIVFSCSLISHPKRVEAAGVPVIDIVHIVLNTVRMMIDIENMDMDTVTAEQQTILTEHTVEKEWFLDSLAFIAKDLVLWEMTESVVGWAKEGFEYPSGATGSFFPSNPSRLFRDLEREATAIFLEDMSEVEFSVPEWGELMLRDIEYNYLNSPSLEEKISSEVEGLDEFLGDFGEGGWNKWIEITNDQKTNPYTLRPLIEEEFNKRVSTRVEREKLELSWGDGALSAKTCDEWVGEWCRSWSSYNPGQIVVQELNKVLQIPLDELLAADEIGEVLGAIFDTLISELMEGILRTEGDVYTE